MAKIYGQLEFAQIHNRTNANRGAAASAGRVVWNTDSGALQLDNGTTWENVVTGAVAAALNTHRINGSINLLYDDFDGAHVAPGARTISNIYMGMIDGGDSGTTTVELYKNGAATGQTASLASAAGAAADSSTGVTLAVVAGDRVTVRMTAKAVGGQDLTVAYD